MTISQRTFRKNFMIVSIIHVVLILSVCLTEGLLKSKSYHSEAIVQLISPADILGDLPEGPGKGRGVYSPPIESAEQLGGSLSSSDDGATFVPKVDAVPSPNVVSHPRQVQLQEPADNIVPLPKVGSAKKGVQVSPKEAKVRSVNASASKKTAVKKVSSNKISTKKLAPKKSVGKGTPKKSGARSHIETASSFRNRFDQALLSENGSSSGTAYGDGKRVGGGSGKSEVLGSPDGAVNGIAGGRGKGSPYWWYYLHVHDKMYEAWEQPGKVLDRDRGLMTTVKLKVARDGSVLNVQLASSSGNGVMDDSAMAAARRVHRLKPLPSGLGNEVAEITVNFELES